MGLFEDVFGGGTPDPRQKVKEQILDRLELVELKRLFKAYGIPEPESKVETFFGTEKRTITRDHFVARAMDRIKFEQLTAFCDKHRIKIQDLMESLKPARTAPPAFSPPPSSPVVSAPIPPAAVPAAAAMPARATPSADPFGAILGDIQDNFEPEDIRSEEDLEKQLVQRLKILHPGNVERQVPTPKGKIDVVLYDQFALEIKIADRVSLRNLIGQALTYKKLYEQMAVVIVDTGRLSRPDLQEFVDEFKALGIQSVILDGVRHRPVKKSRGTTTVKVSRS